MLVRRSGSLKQELGVELDAFICSASFEDRCLSVPKMLVGDVEWQGRALIASNSDSFPSVQDNQDALARMLTRGAVCQLSPDDPIATADQLVSGLRDLLPAARGPQRVGVDVTTFTRESLLILLCCFVEVLHPDGSLVGFYNTARSYEGGAGDGAQWLSRGVREIRSVLGYPGDFRPTRRTHLVVLAGFEDDRAMQLTDELEPSVLSLGSPDPKGGHAHVHDRKMQIRKARWLSHLGCPVNEFIFDGYDLEDCIQSIAVAAEKEPSMNIVMAAMNTKISTLAAGIYALRNPDVQMSYAQADVYNYERYSLAADDVYVFDLSDAIRGLGRPITTG